jgi:hypothetical protein
VRGVQKLLRDRGDAEPDSTVAPIPIAEPEPLGFRDAPAHEETAGVDVFRLIQLRNRLAEALEN